MGSLEMQISYAAPRTTEPVSEGKACDLRFNQLSEIF